tara:strand:+ start:1701 stop:2189 length:489 start_codon:yes stop_codon:yes gene_type:complete
MKSHKKYKNKNLIYLIIFFYIAIFTSGIFDIRTKKIELKIIKYSSSSKIFSDRDYINKKNYLFLKNKILIQQPRHNNQLIKIKINKKVIIYRSLCKKNDNKYYSNWTRIDQKIEVKGITCTHTALVSKRFLPGIIRLLSGGPIASDPIFIELIDNDTKIEFF